METTTRPFDAAIVILADVTRRLPQAHGFAWWPGAGAPQHSRAGSNKTRRPGPLLEPGDPPTMFRYRQFLADLAALERHVHRIAGAPRPRPPLTSKAPAHLVAHRVALCTRRLAVLDSASVDDVEVVGRCVDALARHLDAILPPDPTRQPDLTVCRNPHDRDRCSGFATNLTLRLCRSCENHEQYRRRRRS